MAVCNGGCTTDSNYSGGAGYLADPAGQLALVSFQTSLIHQINFQNFQWLNWFCPNKIVFKTIYFGQ